MLDWLKGNWDLLALILTWAAIVFIKLKRRRDWYAKSFTEQVNFSLNDLDGNRLLLRTLHEDSAQHVWLNEHGVKLLLDAANDTTVEQPFLDLEEPDDMAYVLQAALNVLSEQFAASFVARTVGLPVASARYVFGVTFEKYGAMRTRKLRVIIARPELLERLFGPEGIADDVTFAYASHADRLKTLRVLYDLFHAEDPAKRRMIAEVELGVPTPPG